MAKFFYSVKIENKIEQGYINAVTMADAASELEYKGYTILEINEVFASRNSDTSKEILPLTIKEKKDFFNSFYVQYKSGRTAVQVFETIAASATSENVKMLALHICHKLTKGISFADVFKQYSESIGFLYTNLIAVGDKAGRLDDVLEGIIKNLSKVEKIKSKIIKQVTYPIFIFLLLIGAFIFFNSFVLKALNASITGQSASNGIHLFATILEIAITYVLIFLTFSYLKKNKEIASVIFEKLLNIKACKILFDNYSYFNFFSLLELCFKSGIGAKDSILMCTSVVKDYKTAAKLDKAADRIEQGSNVSTALISTGLFSAFANSQISSAEKSGELETAFSAIASDYEINFNTQISVVLKLVEPVMIIIAGIGLLILGHNFYNSYYESLYKLF